MTYALLERVPYEGDNLLGIYSSKKQALKNIELNRDAQTVIPRGSLFLVKIEVNQPLNHYFSFDGEPV